MSVIKDYIFKRKGGSLPNTFIGGVASTIYSAALLADKLSITESDIKGFKIQGSDISCYIGLPYSINISAFENNLNITSYNDVDGFCTSTSAGKAFKGATNLTSVVLNGVTYLGFETFMNCTSLSNIEINSVTTISYRAFSNVTQAMEMSLPNYTTTIVSAFQNFKGLTKLTVSNLTTITSNILLEGCTNLIEFSANSLTTISGKYTFNGCSNLSILGVNFNSITQLGDYTFQGCSSLTQLVLPNVTGNVGIRTFKGCASLTKLHIPKVTTFSNVFEGCSLLTDLDISGVTSLTGYNNFNGLTNLTHLNLPKLVSNNSLNAFKYLPSLVTLNIPICTLIGADQTNNSAFDKSGITITCPIALQTSNGGAEEGDIAYARNSLSATIIYV